MTVELEITRTRNYPIGNDMVIYNNIGVKRNMATGNIQYHFILN